MIHSPKVSVCMPVYNGSAYIAESIKSVLNQTYKNLNLFVCDNCSTDNTINIVNSFNDPRIRYFCNDENIGLVKNTNRCLELAGGEYVNILHHDDIMFPDNLALKVRILEENPKVGLVHSDVLSIDQEGKPLNLIQFKEAKKDYIEDGKKVFQRYILDMPVGASFFIGAVLARRECYLKLGGYNPILPNTNDSEMWMRILLYYDVACIGKPLVKYRHHKWNVSTSITGPDGLNIQGLEEHYLASKIIIEQNKKRIYKWKRLRRMTLTAFSIRAVKRASLLFEKGEFRMSINFFKTAMKFYPAILTKRVLWIFITRFMIKQIRAILKCVL